MDAKATMQATANLGTETPGKRSAVLTFVDRPSTAPVAPPISGRKPSDRLLDVARMRAEDAACGDGRSGYLANAIERVARSTDLPADRFQPGAGGELIDQTIEPADGSVARWVVDTLEKPDYVAAEASRDRQELAHAAKALAPALDLADSIGAADSIERMMAAQLAVLNRSFMKMAVRLNEEIDRERYATAVPEHLREATSVRAARWAGSMARVAATFQTGWAALEKKKTGGVQKVQVSYTDRRVDQRVTVADGGQAMIAAGDVKPTGGRGRGAKTGGGGRENGA